MTAQEVEETIELEKRGLALVHAALSNKTLVSETLRAFKMEVNGDAGKPWSQVKADLKLA